MVVRHEEGAVCNGPMERVAREWQRACAAMASGMGWQWPFDFGSNVHPRGCARCRGEALPLLFVCVDHSDHPLASLTAPLPIFHELEMADARRMALATLGVHLFCRGKLCVRGRGVLSHSREGSM